MQNLLLIVALSVAVSNVNTAISSLRVVGGRDALSDEYIFVVRIEEAWKIPFNASLELLESTATGSMITPTWVLTCAHCIDGDVKNYRIRYGDISNYTDMTRTRKAVKLLMYPSYMKADSFDHVIQNDIGLVMVESVPVTQLARLSMIGYTTLVGLPVKYAGFGRFEFDDNINITIPLQVGEGGVIPCDKDLPIIRPGICVAPKCNDLFQFVFSGDSGGPLFYEGQVIGITSAVIMHKTERRVTVQMFTPISPFMDWIESFINI